MKKFGKKSNSIINFDDEEEQDFNFTGNIGNIGNISSAYTEDIYSGEMSKKLKMSIKPEKVIENHNDHFFLFKTKSNTESSNQTHVIHQKTNFNPTTLSYTPISNQTCNNNLPSQQHQEFSMKNNSLKNDLSTNFYNKKMKRLSELEQQNLYFLLELKENADKENIKKAYKNLSRVCHPDKGGDPEKFDKINKAYRILSNDFCRKLYDKFSYSAMSILEYILTLEDEANINLQLDLEIFDESNICDLETLKILIHEDKAHN